MQITILFYSNPRKNQGIFTKISAKIQDKYNKGLHLAVQPFVVGRKERLGVEK
jgi:hypothetical protein